ncbi:HEAT repeat domain-containing protein [bacterium]|nr:HEAT repeat domain-containing protein [bacterium]
MKSNFVIGVAAAALLLAAIGMFLPKRPEGPAGQDSLESKIQVIRLEKRLEQLEKRLTGVSARLEGFSPPPVSYHDGDDRENVEETGADLSGEIGRLWSQMNVLSYRIQSLEQDPVSRGYNFVNSESPQLRLEGLASLRRFAPYDSTAREAIRNLLQDPSEQVRREATDALGDLGDKEAAPLMAQMLGDPDPRVRWEAIDSFADWGYKEAAPNIAGMLSDPDPGVRREAVVALGTLGAGETAGQIAQMLSDSSSQVREQAADVLGRLKSQDGASALLQALGDSNEEVRGEAIASLGEIGAVESVPYLRDMYDRNPGRNAIRLATALRSLGDEQPFQQEVARLSEVALSSSDTRARGRAIQTLSWFAREEARDVFTQLSEDSNSGVRREAERALRRRR